MPKFLVLSIFLTLVLFHCKTTDTKYIAGNDFFSEEHHMNYKIAMLGDSITEGVSWNELLGITDIANCGIAGETTGMFYNRLSTVYSVNPKACFIMGGINDINLGISTEQILRNMEAIVEKLEENGIKPVIQSTLYVSNELPGWRMVNKTVEELNNGLKNICIEKGIMFLDVNTVLSADGAIKNENVYDGLHLSGLGYSAWGKLLAPVIENYLD
jgi:lysophospholipase L1-like esterase